jgi:hypothetical protein
LFDAGLADPRGGAYRRIVVSVTSLSRANRQWITNGWYFPDGFAVCWDGLVHKVVQVGSPADLRQDVAASKASFFTRATVGAPPEAGPVSIALLLRLGETELAHQLFVRFLEGPPQAFARPALNEQEWFSAASGAWLSAALDEAMNAHATGDDGLTVDLSELLQGARPRLESVWSGLRSGQPQGAPSPMAFLDPLPTLLSDSERRLKEASRPPFDQAAMSRITSAARISELIDRLEDVDERQLSVPGGIDFMQSPICKMLAAEGAAAVEPLLDAMEHDRRLTRSFGFGQSLRLISVADVAEIILQYEYHLNVFRWNDPARRREWLIANKSRSQAERYFDLLAGDSNDELQWLDAAEGLAGALGEELRQRRNPSLSELLAKRVGQMRTNWAENVALLLYLWDPTAALSSLKRVTRGSYIGTLYGHIIAARLQLGDDSAARDWAATIRTDRVVSLEQLTPLWTKPEDGILQEAARELFSSPNGPMSPSNLLKSGRSVGALIRSPLLIQPVFRESVADALGRKDVVGTAERRSDGYVTMHSPDSSVTCAPGQCGAGFPVSHPPGKQNIRAGDYIAWLLSRIDGFPAIEIEASEEEKDRSIARIRDFLRSHGTDLRAPPPTERTYPDPLVTLVAK